MNDSLDGDYHSLHFIYEEAEAQKSYNHMADKQRSQDCLTLDLELFP